MALNERQAQAQLYLHALEEEAKASLSMVRLFTLKNTFLDKIPGCQETKLDEIGIAHNLINSI